MQLTRNQAKFLVCLLSHEREHGVPATFRDIIDRGRFSSTSVVAYQRDRLTEKGLVTYRHDTVRSMRLTAEGRRAAQELRNQV